MESSGRPLEICHQTTLSRSSAGMLVLSAGTQFTRISGALFCVPTSADCWKSANTRTLRRHYRHNSGFNSRPRFCPRDSLLIVFSNFFNENFLYYSVFKLHSSRRYTSVVSLQTSEVSSLPYYSYCALLLVMYYFAFLAFLHGWRA